MRGNRLRHLVTGLSLITPFIYLYVVWPKLGDRIPLHFDAQMEPDRFGSKTELLIPVFILTAVSFFLYLLLTNLTLLDPKYGKTPSPEPMGKLAVCLVVFMSVINIVVIYSAFMPISSRIVYVLLGVFFGVLGYLMRDIKPNYFAGIRLPWTLEDPDNWQKTHLLTGRVWVWGSVFFIIASHLVHNAGLASFFLIYILILIIWPVVYSFTLYLQGKRDKTNPGQ